ncbi:DUF6406 domain-containing protein [Streptomyces sp. NPDC000075]|uniref:DUF6406 domain-containing protein n=1 Tax=Streptomyces TaxID=1883 RepID=UPI0031E078BB
MLQHAAPWVRADATFVAVHVYAPDGGGVKVFLVVKADEEEEYELGIGGAFTVRGEMWSLDRVENQSSRDYLVFLRKVG